MKIKDTNRYRRFEFVSFALMIALMLLAQHALATDVTGAWGYGTTTVDSSTCDADVAASASFQTDVRDYDYVYIYYYLNWTDSRSASSPVAYHNFTLTASYGVNIYYKDKNVTTYGATSGYDTIHVVVPDVLEDTTITVDWTASIESTNPSCQDSDAIRSYIFLY